MNNQFNEKRTYVSKSKKKNHILLLLDEKGRKKKINKNTS